MINQISSQETSYSIDIWDVSNGEKLRTFSHGGSVRCIAFDPKGRSVCAYAYAASESVIAVWDLAEGKRQWAVQASYVTSVAFSPDGKYIASGSQSGVVEILDASTGKKTLSLYHGASVYDVSFSSNGKTVLSGGREGKIKIWDATSGIERLTLAVPGETLVEAVVLSPDEKQLIACCRTGVWVWELEGNNEVNSAAHGFMQPGIDPRSRLPDSQ